MEAGVPRSSLNWMVAICLIAACDRGVAVPSDSDSGRSPPDLASVDLATPNDALANCADPLPPPVTALFGTSPHVPARQVVQLSDSALLGCGALDGTPACSCQPPCSCWSLTITLPSPLGAGQYALADLGATFTEQHSANGGWSSTSHPITDGALTLFEAEASGLVGVVCGLSAKGIGALGVAGSFQAGPCK